VVAIFNDRLSPERLRELFDFCPIEGKIWWRNRPEGPPEWNANYAGKLAGTVKNGYLQISISIEGRSRFFSGQRVMWALFYGKWPDGEVDHEDHQTLNNSILNLRESTHSQNASHKLELRGKVKYKGVYYLARLGKYAAQIKVNKEHTWLGLYDRAEDAAKAYDCTALMLHGKFAKTNAQMGLL
jgi:hypothetical protein